MRAHPVKDYQVLGIVIDMHKINKKTPSHIPYLLNVDILSEEEEFKPVIAT